MPLSYAIRRLCLWAICCLPLCAQAMVVGDVSGNYGKSRSAGGTSTTGSTSSGSGTFAAGKVQPGIPRQASMVGYTQNTFASTFEGDVDLANSRASGVNWYLSKWFGWPATAASTVQIVKNQGITLTNGGDTANYTIGSAAENFNKPSHWVGTAFGGGGYFEAVLKFDTKNVTAPGAIGFPAWWTEPVEHMQNPNTDAWVGQPAGYEHYDEPDIFEYIPALGTTTYAATVHEWYGIYQRTCQPQFCQISNNGDNYRLSNNIVTPPANTDFNQYHKYGMLWVPATATAQGYIQYYFDDVATTSRVSWDKFTTQAPPPGSVPWTFGVVDQQHLVLILGTGDNQPMTVQSVNVWQKGSANNLKY